MSFRGIGKNFQQFFPVVTEGIILVSVLKGEGAVF